MKFLSWPINPIIITQHFGENKACVDLETGVKYITCDGLNPPQGYRSLYGPKGHLGLDLLAAYSQGVFCAKKGEVTFIDTQSKSGLDVRIVSVVEGRTFRHIYEHLLGYQHKIGDIVETGQLIGWADNTGYSSGNHLHFQVEEWIGGEWIPIDPELYLGDMFAKDVMYYENKITYLKEQIALLAEKISDYLRTKNNV